jgi:hypothetical protein
MELNSNHALNSHLSKDHFKSSIIHVTNPRKINRDVELKFRETTRRKEPRQVEYLTYQGIQGSTANLSDK